MQGGQAVLIKNCHGSRRVLAACPFEWAYGQEYALCLTHVGGRLSLSIDGRELLETMDNEYTYGMAGYAMDGLGRCLFFDLTIEEKEA